MGMKSQVNNNRNMNNRIFWTYMLKKEEHKMEIYFENGVLNKEK